MQQKNAKKVLVSEIIATEFVSLNCLCEEQDPFHRQPMCLQAVPRFGMSIRETFSDTTYLPVTNESDKGAVIQTSTVFGHVYHIACPMVLCSGIF